MKRKSVELLCSGLKLEIKNHIYKYGKLYLICICVIIFGVIFGLLSALKCGSVEKIKFFDGILFDYVTDKVGWFFFFVVKLLKFVFFGFFCYASCVSRGTSFLMFFLLFYRACFLGANMAVCFLSHLISGWIMALFVLLPCELILLLCAMVLGAIAFRHCWIYAKCHCSIFSKYFIQSQSRVFVPVLCVGCAGILFETLLLPVFSTFLL